MDLKYFIYKQKQMKFYQQPSDVIMDTLCGNVGIVPSAFFFANLIVLDFANQIEYGHIFPYPGGVVGIALFTGLQSCLLERLKYSNWAVKYSNITVSWSKLVNNYGEWYAPKTP